MLANVNQSISLDVFNAKARKLRIVSIVPNVDWGGDGLVGCSVRFCRFEHAGQSIWHVLEVEPNSPASEAGLRSNTDYIVCAPATILKGQNSFYE